MPPMLRDASADAGGVSPFGDLPEWNLDDLYPGPEAPALRTDLDEARQEAAALAEQVEGKMAGLSGDRLADAVIRYERLQRRLGRVMSYAGLRHYQNTTDAERAKFLGDMQNEVTELTAPTVFFSLELNSLDDDALAAKLAESETLRRYKPWVDRLRAFKPHQLSQELETFLHDQSVVGTTAWNRLFDETMARLEFSVDGEDGPLPLEATLTLLSDGDRAKREAAAKALSEVFAQNLPLFSRIMNTLVKEHEIEGRWRKMPSPQHGRHLSNHVEPEVVEALRDAVTKAYPRLSHRYYAMKARWLGLDRLQHWDRNAPLPDDEDRRIPWDEARATVMDAYAGFDPKMAEIARPFFEKGWIDAPAKPGKAAGAFAHPTVTDVHPYIMLNYLGKTRDVMTLAHELGH
ncbi:MAG: M3 family metallopeptidase, partial [Pseudomonadota bacterium]